MINDVVGELCILQGIEGIGGREGGSGSRKS